MQAATRDGPFVKGTKTGLFAKLTTKDQTTLVQEFDVRNAIVHEVPIVCYWSSIPLLELSGRGFGAILFFLRHETCIIGIEQVVIELWKIPLFEIVGMETKRFHKRS